MGVPFRREVPIVFLIYLEMMGVPFRLPEMMGVPFRLLRFASLPFRLPFRPIIKKWDVLPLVHSGLVYSPILDYIILMIYIWSQP